MAPFIDPTLPIFSIPSPSSPSPTPATDPVAIVGLACRTAGASSPSKLWDLVVSQRDVQRKMPSDRFNVDAFYHPTGANKGTTNAKFGYFLDQDIANFDAGFFNISGREAEAMDPQQRLLLEVVYEALENGEFWHIPHGFFPCFFPVLFSRIVKKSELVLIYYL